MTTGRIKQKYNATPTAAEKAYHIWLIENFVCACGCGLAATVVHHPMQRHPAQRWRRDHEYVVPMFWKCHDDLHRNDPRETGRYAGMSDNAAEYRLMGINRGKLPDRLTA